MPYRIFEKGGQYEVMNIASGRGHGKTTKKKAEAQMRLLHGLKKGWKPTKK
jgi:hypothetical protein